MAVFIANNVSLLSIQIAAVLILPATRMQISSGLLELLREWLYAYWKWRFEDISVLYFITKILEDSVQLKCPKSHSHLLGLFPAQFSPKGMFDIACFCKFTAHVLLSLQTQSIKPFIQLFAVFVIVRPEFSKKPIYGDLKPRQCWIHQRQVLYLFHEPSSFVFANCNTHFLTDCLLLPAHFALHKNTTSLECVVYANFST